MNRVKTLETRGTTALGPGLALCSGLVSASPGAEIILCTDGLPNVGVGKLSKQSADHDPEFYSTVNTTLSFIWLPGTGTYIICEIYFSVHTYHICWNLAIKFKLDLNFNIHIVSVHINILHCTDCVMYFNNN